MDKHHAIFLGLLAFGNQVVNARDDEVPGNDYPEALEQSKPYNHQYGEDDERVAKLVALPSPLLKLEGEHRNLSNQ